MANLRSQPGSTMTGDFPPSSSVIGVRNLAAASATKWATQLPPICQNLAMK